MASLRGRVGVAVTPETLAYVTAGVPFGTVTSSGTVSGATATGTATRDAVQCRDVPLRLGRWAPDWKAGCSPTGPDGSNTLHSDLGSFRAMPNMAAGMTAAFDSDAQCGSTRSGSA